MSELELRKIRKIPVDPEAVLVLAWGTRNDYSHSVVGMDLIPIIRCARAVLASDIGKILIAVGLIITAVVLVLHV